MSTVSEIATIVAALRQQGWEVTLSNDGAKWKARPPEKAQQIVIFSAHPSSGHPLVQVIRELRQQGFVWPPNNQPARDERAVVRSVPFGPRPNPLAETRTAASEPLVTPPPPPTVDQKKQLANAVASDLLFEELKQAKEYRDLAGAELVEASNKLEAAKLAHTSAMESYSDAVRSLQEKKRAFDRAFGSEDVASQLDTARRLESA